MEEIVKDENVSQKKIFLFLSIALVLFLIKPAFCLLIGAVVAVIAILKNYKIGLFILGGLSFTQISSLEILESYHVFLLSFILTFLSFAIFFSKDLKFEIRIDPIYKMVFLLYIVILFSGLYAENNYYWREEVYAFMRAFILFFVIIQGFDDEESFYIMGKVIILSLVFSSVLLFTDFVRNNYGGMTVLFMRFSGGVGDPNDFAMLLNIAFPLCIFFIKHEKEILMKAIFILCSLSLIFFLIATQSRGGIIAFLISLILILMISKNRVKILAIFIMLIVVLLTIFPIELIVPRIVRLYNIFTGKTLSDPSFLQRFTLYKSAISIFFQSPLFGVGANNFIVHSVRFITRPLFAHNLLLEIAVGLGLIGLIPFVVILATPFSRFYAIIREAELSDNIKFADYVRFFRISFIAMLITSLFLSCQTKTYFWIVLGMAYSLKFVKYKKEVKSDFDCKK